MDQRFTTGDANGDMKNNNSSSRKRLPTKRKISVRTVTSIGQPLPSRRTPHAHGGCIKRTNERETNMMRQQKATFRAKHKRYAGAVPNNRNCTCLYRNFNQSEAATRNSSHTPSTRCHPLSRSFLVMLRVL